MSTEEWFVPVGAIRSLNPSDRRLDWLRANLDQVVSNTVVVTVERYSEPVDFGGRMSPPIGIENRVPPLADTVITIKDPNSDFEVWQPADYAKVSDLLALLPKIGVENA